MSYSLIITFMNGLDIGTAEPVRAVTFCEGVLTILYHDGRYEVKENVKKFELW